MVYRVGDKKPGGDCLSARLRDCNERGYNLVTAGWSGAIVCKKCVCCLHSSQRHCLTVCSVYKLLPVPRNVPVRPSVFMAFLALFHSQRAKVLSLYSTLCGCYAREKENNARCLPTWRASESSFFFAGGGRKWINGFCRWGWCHRTTESTRNLSGGLILVM